MSNITISIYGNQLFEAIVKELMIFSEYKIKFYDDLNLCIQDSKKNNQLIIFFLKDLNKKDYEKMSKNRLPTIVISDSSNLKNIILGDFVEKLVIPINMLDLKKKVVHLFAKLEFNLTSLINLNGYIIDKNERKIKKNNLELILTEKEINFLILFSENNKILDRNFVLKNVWNYSPESDTHTLETHIHRLRRKILQKFNDNNFIKNNNKGYYI